MGKPYAIISWFDKLFRGLGMLGVLGFAGLAGFIHPDWFPFSYYSYISYLSFFRFALYFYYPCRPEDSNKLATITVGGVIPALILIAIPPDPRMGFLGFLGFLGFSIPDPSPAREC
ncbi:MAG: hypothetical protein ACE15F_15605 [bacterium]